MASDPAFETVFLRELYTLTNGDPSAQASSTDIGARLGMDESDASEMGQNLCIQGLAELKTLSGGIGITLQGLKALDVSPASDVAAAHLTLGQDRILGRDDIKAVDIMLAAVKDALAQTSRPYPDIESMVIDVKTIEVQMLSSQPKTLIIKAVFRSLADHFNATGPDDLAKKLTAFISS
jgi:alpha-D-ribose 1-methylphosphonate 5-triphosphate synthase subunit PhnG